MTVYEKTLIHGQQSFSAIRIPANCASLAARRINKIKRIIKQLWSSQKLLLIVAEFLTLDDEGQSCIQAFSSLGITSLPYTPCKAALCIAHPQARPFWNTVCERAPSTGGFGACGSAAQIQTRDASHHRPTGSTASGSRDVGRGTDATTGHCAGASRTRKDHDNREMAETSRACGRVGDR